MLSEQLKQLKGSPTAKFFRLAKEREAQGHDVAHLEIGQPDFQPLPEVLATTVESINKGETTYAMSPGILELRKEIENVYNSDYGVKIDANKEIIADPNMIYPTTILNVPGM